MSAHTEHRNVPKGSRPGPYEIVSSIGAGGMGELFRARDTLGPVYQRWPTARLRIAER